MIDKVTPRVRNIPPSGIRKYFDLLNEMKSVISLGVGDPDFDTPWAIRKAATESLLDGKTHYTGNAGLIELRKAICKYQKRKYGLDYKPENEILVTVGGSEAIDLIMRSIAGPGDEIILTEPNFVPYKACVALTGATPVIICLNASDNFKLTADALKSAITPRTKALVFTFPNNPTGAIMEEADLDAIYEVLADKDIILISDEIYSELTYKGKHKSLASYPGMKERSVVINGFSKTFSMTGWRLGYACGPAELINAMFKIHQYAIMCAPTTSQHAAVTALEKCDSDVDEMKKEYNRRRRVMVNGMREAGLECFDPLGAFYVFPDIRRTGLTSEEFCERLLVEHQVLMIPGTAFGECGEGFVRATYSNSLENIIEAMRRLKEFTGKCGL